MESIVGVIGELVERRAHGRMHILLLLAHAVDEAVGMGSHLQWLAG